MIIFIFIFSSENKWYSRQVILRLQMGQIRIKRYKKKKKKALVLSLHSYVAVLSKSSYQFLEDAYKNHKQYLETMTLQLQDKRKAIEDVSNCINAG